MRFSKVLLAAFCLVMIPAFAGAVVINEIRIDQPSGDNDEYFELAGDNGESLDGLTYVVIGDGTGGSGVVETAADLTGSVIPADGHFLAAESTWTGTCGDTPDLTTTLNFENGDNVTHLLVTNFTGAVGDDLDVDEDGNLDDPPWDAVVDCVALLQSADSGDLTYCDTTVGPDGTYVPGHVFLCDGDWYIGAFDFCVLDTPGMSNIPSCETVPVEDTSFGSLKSLFR